MSTTESQALAPVILSQEERQIAHQALDRLLDSGVGGSTHDPDVAASFMEIASRKHILLSPVMGAFRMRPGWELAFTKLRVDTRKEAGLVYKVSGNEDDEDRGREWGDNTLLAFHKPLLYQIRTHLGINMEDLERIDDRSDPLLHEYKVKGSYLGVDGQIHGLIDQGGLDLRDGSEAANKIFAEARGRTVEEREAKARKALMLKRAKIMQFATTNAEERLIVSYGFRSAYRKSELDSKFIVCVRPIFTGYHPNPEIQAKLLDYMLAEQTRATGMLYGGTSAQAATTQKAIPAVTQSIRPALTEPKGPAEQLFEEPEKPKAWIVPFGKHKDKPITELSDDALSGLLDANVDMCEMIKDKPMMKAEFEAHMGYQKEIEAEVARRQKREEKY